MLSGLFNTTEKYKNSERKIYSFLFFSFALSICIIFSITVSTSAEATNNPSCISVIEWKGDPAIISIVRRVLSGGILINIKKERCLGVRIYLFSENSQIYTEISKAKRKIVNRINGVETVSTWIESFLVPPISVKVKPPISYEDNENPLVIPSKIDSKVVNIPVVTSVLAGISFNKKSWGSGFNLEIAYPYKNKFLIGLSTGYTNWGLNKNIKYDDFMVDFVFGTKVSYNRLNFVVGVKAGVVSTELFNYDYSSEFNTLTNNRNDIVASLFLRSGIKISTKIVMTLGLSLQYRAYNFDFDAPLITNYESTGDNIGDENQYAFIPVERLVFMTQIGFDWNLGNKQ